MTKPTSYTYQWHRTSSGGTATISGATAATYALQTADEADTIGCTVTGANSAGSTSSNSAVTAKIAGPSSGSNAAAPLVVPAVNGAGASLRTVGSSNRLKLQGVAIWGITDLVTENGGTGQNNYNDRVAVCQGIAALGGTCIRLRVLGYEYDNLQYMSSTANYLTWVTNWVAAAQSAGLYTMITNWDSLDSPSANNGQWASNYGQSFPMLTAIHSALRVNGVDNPYVFYEPFNEPNNVSWSQWQTAMQATVQLFRSTCDYQGMLVLDTTTWSHDYSDQYMGALESYDAGLTTSKKHNLAFARHDYCNDYANDIWTDGAWVAATGGSETAHVLMETEFGNYNDPNESQSFSSGETAGYASDMYQRSNIAGGCAFVWNWVDANCIANLPSSLVNPWGTDVAGWLAG